MTVPLWGDFIHPLTIADYERLAEAGIPHYWIIDVDEPVSLVECHPVGELGYQDNGSVTGEFSTTVPFPVRFDLAELITP